MLQFITDINSPLAVNEQIKDALEGGCRWIQIRMDSSSDDEIAKVVEEIKPICIEKEAFLIMDGKPELAKTLNVGGVFLRKGDMPCSKARMLLGPAAVIGVEVSAMTDVLAVSALDIDYFGIGPYYPLGKSGEADRLDLDAVKSLCSEMEKAGIAVPRVVFGSIPLEVVLALIESGANGIAVSDEIADAADVVESVKDYLRFLPAIPGD